MNRTILLFLAVILTAGCAKEESVQSAGPSKVDLQAEVHKQARRISQLQQTIAEQRKQIDTINALGGEKRLEKLYYPVRIELGAYTGGVSTNGEPYDNAVRVYLQPIDRDGNALKAAGSVKIQVFDLAAPRADNLVHECTYDVDQVRKHWAGGFLAYHYTFDCAWKTPPSHEQLTVRVEFTDYLTGKTLTSQKVVTVHLASEQANETGD